MYYSLGKSKESEQYPRIMSKEDTKELSSIINLLNSSSAENEKIGLNLQYRQVKIPQTIYNALNQRRLNCKNYLENEKKDKNNNDIIDLYEENKSAEENFIRSKMFEIENLEKKIKKLNSEEAQLIQEIDNGKNNLKNLSQKLNLIQNENEKIKNFIKSNESEEKNMQIKIKEIQEQNIKQKEKLENLKNVEKYTKEKQRIKEEESKIKKMLCYKCKSQPRIVYYSVCEHLALCKNCHAEAGYNLKCPICKLDNEFVFNVDLGKNDNNNNEFIL